MFRTPIKFLVHGLFLVFIAFSCHTHQSVTGHNIGQEQSWSFPNNKITTVPDKISILTFNVRGLPNTDEVACDNLVRIGKKLGEMRSLGQAPAIVAIQEGFHRKMKDLIVLSGYPYVQEGPTGKKANRVTSGLWILSEFPITQKSNKVFSSCVSWDCLANKGIGYVTIEVPVDDRGKTVSLEIFNTHMNAFLNTGDIFTSNSSLVSAKKRQIKEFHEFVTRTHNPGSFGSVLVGDFNFKRGDVYYSYFKSLFGVKNPTNGLLSGIYDFLLNGPNLFPKSVDYQFVYNNTDNIRPLGFKKIFDRTYSDHLGLVVEYELGLL